MATITYKVTVATGTNKYGTGNKYYINGEANVVLYLQEGNTYIFDTSDSTNGTHVFAFSTNPNNSPAAPYTTGVTTTCLLYTSPSPRDRQKSRMPSSA